MPRRENSLDTLRREEELLEYVYQNQLDLKHTSLSEEEISRFLNTEGERSRFQTFVDLVMAHDGERVLRAEDCLDSEERIGVFLHPRFLPSVSHLHPYHEIKYVICGRVALAVNKQSMILEAGDFCFIAPMVEHSTAIFDPTTLLVNIEIRSEALRVVFQRVFQTENPISTFYNVSSANKERFPILLCRTGEDTEIQDLLKLIYDYKAETVRQGHGELTGEMLVEQLLLLLLDRHSAAFSNGQNNLPQNHIMFEILDFIYQNLKDLTLTELSQHFNYSEAYMSRFIKRNSGLSFSELLLNARLDYAAELLRDTNMPVSAVISEVGYAGKAHFYRVFQTKFGLTPMKLREKFRPGVSK